MSKQQVSKLSIRVRNVKFYGHGLTSVKFTASAKRQVVHCVSPLFHNEGSIDIRKVSNSKTDWFEATSSLGGSQVYKARTPDKCFAGAAKLWWVH